ncbi:hypothetical protein [Humidesulfovibrio sp.]
MPNIIIKIRINKPGNTVPVARLHETLGVIPEYLRSYGLDVGIGSSETWLMSDATQKNKRDAITFNLVSSGVYSKSEADTFSDVLSWPLRGLDYAQEKKISHRTVELFTKIGKNFQESDRIFMGTYKSVSHKPTWAVIDKQLTIKVQERKFELIEFYGDIQGVIKSFTKETKKNKCKVQELLFGSVVDCEFDNDMYSDVVSLLAQRDAIVNVYGICTATKHDGRIVKVVIDRISESPGYEDGDISRFRGCMKSLEKHYSADNLPQWLKHV